MSLSISDFVRVEVNTGAVSVSEGTYDVGMILIDNANWPSSVATRTVTVASGSDATSKGFNTNVVNLVNIYFSQNQSPGSLVLGHYGANSESMVDGLTACRNEDSTWYMFTVANLSGELTSTEIANCALATEAFSFPTIFVYATNEANCIVASSSNIMATLKNADYDRTLGFYYSSTQVGEHPAQAYIHVAVLGLACGYNKTTQGSAYSLAFKVPSGSYPVNISDSEYLTLKGYNGNIFANVSDGKFRFIMNGIMASGVHYDEIFAIDVLRNKIETAVMNLFSSSLVIPQTNSGIAMITARVSKACDDLVSIGYIAPGIWKGQDFRELSNGDALPSGYKVMVESFEEQSEADREQRIAPTIYVCIKLAGAVEYVVVQVNVNR